MMCDRNTYKRHSVRPPVGKDSDFHHWKTHKFYHMSHTLIAGDGSWVHELPEGEFQAHGSGPGWVEVERKGRGGGTRLSFTSGRTTHSPFDGLGTAIIISFYPRWDMSPFVCEGSLSMYHVRDEKEASRLVLKLLNKVVHLRRLNLRDKHIKRLVHGKD